MKNKINQILFGKDKIINGLMVGGLLALFTLGCVCNKEFKLDSTKDNKDTKSAAESSSDAKKSDNPFPVDKSSDSGDTSNKPDTSGERADIPKDTGSDILTNGKLQSLIKRNL